MTFHELLVLAGGAGIGAGLVLLSVVAALLRRRRIAARDPGVIDLHRAGRRLRQLERMARHTEVRLNGRMDELRHLLARAEQVLPHAAGGGEDAVAAEPGPLPAILEKQRDQIFRLRFQGLETVDIARRLRLPIGEVELTLKLHQRQQDHAGAGAGN
jgi:hypothetical protein